MPNEPAEDRSVRGNTLRPHTVDAQKDVTVPDGQGGKISVSELAKGLPSGGIIMWSGAIKNIPNGWTLCDGTDGAPNLQDRFVVGAGNSYSVDETGGEEEHTLTVEEMPSHEHDYTRATGASFGSGGSNETGDDPLNTTTDQTQVTGGDQPHENRPPYYALAFIMKK